MTWEQIAKQRQQESKQAGSSTPAFSQNTTKQTMSEWDKISAARGVVPTQMSEAPQQQAEQYAPQYVIPQQPTSIVNSPARTDSVAGDSAKAYYDYAQQLKQQAGELQPIAEQIIDIPSGKAKLTASIDERKAKTQTEMAREQQSGLVSEAGRLEQLTTLPKQQYYETQQRAAERLAEDYVITDPARSAKYEMEAAGYGSLLPQKELTAAQKQQQEQQRAKEFADTPTFTEPTTFTVTLTDNQGRKTTYKKTVDPDDIYKYGELSMAEASAELDKLLSDKAYKALQEKQLKYANELTADELTLYKTLDKQRSVLQSRAKDFTAEYLRKAQDDKDFAEIAARGAKDKNNPIIKTGVADEDKTATEAYISYATRTEKQLLNYYYGLSKADGDKYAKWLGNELTTRMALDLGESSKGLVSNVTLATLAGLERFITGVTAPALAAVGAEQSVNAYGIASQANIQRLKAEKKSTVGLELVTTIANQIPSILIGRSLGSATAGSLAMGTSAGGSAMGEAIKEGYDPYSAAMYGVVIGLSETMLERVLGGINAFGGFASTAFGKTTLGKIESLARAIAKKPKLQTLLSSIMTYVGASSAEFVEESLQSIMEPAFRRYILQDQEAEVKWDEVFYEGLLGFYSALILNSTSGGQARNIIQQTILTPKTQAEVQAIVANVNTQVEAINDVVLVLPNDTKIEPLKENASFDQAQRKQAEVYSAYIEMSVAEQAIVDKLHAETALYKQSLQTMLEIAETGTATEQQLETLADDEHGRDVFTAVADVPAPESKADFKTAVQQFAQQTLFNIEQEEQIAERQSVATAVNLPTVAPQSTQLQDNALPEQVLPETETQAPLIVEPTTAQQPATAAAPAVEAITTTATEPTVRKRRTQAEIIADQKAKLAEQRKQAREAIKKTRETEEAVRKEAVAKEKEKAERKLTKLTEQHIEKRTEYDRKYRQLKEDNAYLKAETKLTKGKARADIKSAREFATNLLTEVDSKFDVVQMERFVRELYKMAHSEQVNWSELQKSAEAIAFSALESTAASQDADIQAETAEVLGNKILADMLYIEPSQPTFADIKYAEKTEALIDMRARYEQRIAEMKRTQKERATKKKLQAVIKGNTDRMAILLKRRSDKQHIPHGLGGEVNAFLASLDKTTDRQGETTHDKLIALAEKYLANVESTNPELYDETLKEALTDFYTLAEKGMRLADMTNEQLYVVANAAAYLNHAITNANKAFAQQSKVNIDTLVADALQDVEERAKRWGLKKREDQNRISKLFNDDQVNPFDKFSEWGNTISDMFWNTYGEGFKDYTFRIRDVAPVFQEIIKNTDFEKWTGDKAKTVTVELSSGNYELTPAQIMYVYVSANQAEGLAALLNGGIKLKQQFGKRSGVRVPITPLYHDNVKLTPADVDLLTSSEYMTSDMKRVADDIVGKISPMLAEYGNATSLKVYGYEKFNVPNYFALMVEANKATTDKAVTEQTRPTLASWGGAKTRNEDGHSYPLSGLDFFNVFYENMERMIKYSSMLPYTLDLRRVMRNPELKAKMKSVFGNGAEAYFRTMIADIEKSSGKLTPEHGSELAEKFIRNVKSAVIPANISVLAKQYTSYIRATGMINAKYLSQALGVKADWEVVKKYSPEAVWKDWGYFELGFGQSMSELMTGKEGFADKLMGLISKADTQTWGKIWTAIELETADTTSLEKGTDSFYEHVAKKFAKVIASTQVIDTVFHRSQAQRTDSTYMRMASSFMSEPLKDYNFNRTAWRNYILVSGLNKGSTDPTAIAEVKKARNEAIKATAASLAQNLTVSWVGTIFGLFRSKKHPDEIDTEEMFSMLGEEMLDNVFGMFMYLKTAWSLWRGWSSTSMDMKGVEAIANALSTTYDFVLNGKGTPVNALKKGLEAISYGIGIPLATVERDLSAVYRNIIQRTKSETLEYGYVKMLNDINNKANASKFYDVLYRAYKNGDSDSYSVIVTDMKENGFTDDNIRSAIESRSKKANGSLSARYTEFDVQAFVQGSFANDGYATSLSADIPENKADTYFKKRGELAGKTLNEIKDLPMFTRLTADEQDTVVRNILTYAAERTEAQITHTKMSGWVADVHSVYDSVDVSKHIVARQIYNRNKKSNPDFTVENYRFALSKQGFTSREINAIIKVR